MKTPLLITLVILIFSSLAQSQGLQLLHKGKEKTLDQDKYYIIYTLNKQNDCPSKRFSGSILDHNKDSIKLSIDFFEKISCSDEYSDTYSRKYFKAQENWVAKESICQIDQWRSQKSFNRKDALGGLGGLATVSGIVTGLTSIFISDANIRENLLIASGLQLGVGVTFISFSFPHKTYKTADNQTQLKFVNP